MIDVLRDSFATQEQIAETAQNALVSIYTIEILLAVVVVLLILSLISQARILSVFHDVNRQLFEFKEHVKGYHAGFTLHTATHVWKPRKRRKSQNRKEED